MKLRNKAILIIGMGVLILTALLYGQTATSWLNSFNKIEDQNVRTDVQRVLNAVENELSNLDKTTDDWAAWDDTYIFMQDVNQKYLDVNLVDNTFIGLQLNLMLFLAKDGHIVYGKAFDLQNQVEKDLPAGLESYLTADSPPLAEKELNSSVKGVLMLNGMPMLVAARPILTSEKQGPANGVLLLGSNFDQQTVEQIAQLTSLTFDIYPYQTGQFPNDVQQALPQIEDGKIFIKTLDKETIAGFALLKDINSLPAIVVRIERPKTIYAQARQGTGVLVFAFLLFGLASSAMILVLLDQTILGRLSHLVQQIKEITSQGDPTMRLNLTGKDEISDLARSINDMLASLKRAQEQAEATLVELEAQTEALADANHSLQIEIARREEVQEMLQVLTRQQERLIEAAQNLAQSLDVHQVLQRISDGAQDILRADGCAIYLLENDHTTLTPVVTADSRDKEQILATPLHIGHSFTGLAVKSRKGMIFNEAGSDDRGFQISNTPEEENEKIIVAPLIVDDEVIGAIYLDRGFKDFNKQDLSTAETFAAYAATVLKNARTYDELQREILERRQVEIALRVSEQQYRHLFNNVPVGLYRTSAEGQILDANQALAEMLGFDDSDSLKQNNVAQFSVDVEDREKAHRLLEDDGILQGYEMQLRRKDGKIIWVSDTFRAVYDANRNLQYYEGNLVEITERKNAEIALQESEQRYRTLVEDLPVGVFRTTPGEEGKYLMANKAFLNLMGLQSEEELHAYSLIDLYIQPEVRNAFSDELLTKGNLSGKELLLKNKDGKPFWGIVNGRVITDRRSQPQYFDCTVQDITSRKQAEKVQNALYQLSQAANETHNLDDLFKRVHQVIQELIPAKNFYVALFDPLTSIIHFPFFVDEHDPAPTPRKLDKSLTAYVIRHSTPLLALPDVFDDLVDSGEVESVGTPSVDWLGVPLRTIDKVTIGAMVVQTYDEGVRYSNSDKELMAIVSSQVTTAIERKQVEEKLSYNAFHDELTGLPNRTLFIDRLEHAIKLSQRRKDHWFAVLFLDLDRFKTVNDSLGHVLGDQLLVSASRRLQICLRDSDTVARFGGDEFVILLEDLEDTSYATQVAERILKEMIAPFNLAGHEILTSVSIGIVFGLDDYTKPEEVLRDADIAMYQAKNLGRSRYVIFNTTMRAHVVAHIELENDLRAATERQELELYYQPIIALKSSKMIGFEALVRWNHPVKGLIHPGDFIPLAEDSGLIIPMGEWILRQACKQMSDWHKQFPSDPPLTISVNLSNRQFSQPELFDQIDAALTDSQFDARYLRLEITESVIMENAELAIATLNRLRQLGVQIYIDDFGTGYSSLVYLHLLPINAIKIDRSFISGDGIKENGLEIAQTIVRLAHDLKMEAIAEGVETPEQLEKLKLLDCEYAQGYHISHCLNEQRVVELLSKTAVLQI